MNAPSLSPRRCERIGDVTAVARALGVRRPVRRSVWVHAALLASLSLTPQTLAAGGTAEPSPLGGDGPEAGSVSTRELPTTSGVCGRGDLAVWPTVASLEYLEGLWDWRSLIPYCKAEFGAPCEVATAIRLNVQMPYILCVSPTELSCGDLGASIVESPELGWLRDQCNDDADRPIVDVDGRRGMLLADIVSRTRDLPACYSTFVALDDDDIFSVETWHGIVACSGYRLPTSTEWRVAARSLNSDIPIGASTRIEGSSHPAGRVSIGQAELGIVSVRELHPSPEGAYGFIGNVAELVWDFVFRSEFGETPGAYLGRVVEQAPEHEGQCRMGGDYRTEGMHALPMECELTQSVGNVYTSFVTGVRLVRTVWLEPEVAAMLLHLRRDVERVFAHIFG